MKTKETVLFSLSLIAGLLLTFPGALPAQEHSLSMVPRNLPLHNFEEDLIEAIAEYIGDRKIDFYHQKMGFDPPANGLDNYKYLSTFSKIEMAYIAAAKGERESEGGERYLALLSQSLAQDYYAAKEDITLQDLLSRNLTSKAIKFSYDIRFPFDDLLPEHHRPAIKALADYCDYGNLEPILAQHFDLSRSIIRGIIRSSDSTKSAISRAVQSLGSIEERWEALSSIAVSFLKRYHALAYDDTVISLLEGRHRNLTPGAIEIASESKLTQIEANDYTYNSPPEIVIREIIGGPREARFASRIESFHDAYSRIEYVDYSLYNYMRYVIMEMPGDPEYVATIPQVRQALGQPSLREEMLEVLRTERDDREEAYKAEPLTMTEVLHNIYRTHAIPYGIYRSSEIPYKLLEAMEFYRIRGTPLVRGRR